MIDSILKHIDLPFKIPTSDKTIKIAVTGLSKSGKTVFITSLINQLIANDKLEYVHEKLNRSFTAKLLPPDTIFTRFDYYNKLKSFRAKDPRWPKSTKSVTKTTVQLEIKSEYSFLENQIVNLELIDYPGEWLLDLTMIGKSYQTWSEEMLALANEEKRLNEASDWLKVILSTDLYGDINENSDEEIVHIYNEYLQKLYKKGFSFIQPGRFLQPADLEHDPILLFTPLPLSENGTEINNNSIYTRFEQRYDKYVKEIVKKLYLKHFKSFDTQIVLIDLIKTLQNGYDTFEDMHYAIKNILKTFTYGSNNFLTKLFQLKIDHAVFAATKADHIPISQHNSYKKLLEEMISDIKNELNVKHIETDVTIISSVKSTQFVKAKIKEHTVDCVRGIVEGEKEPSTYYPGALPEHINHKEFWEEYEYDFPTFKPISFPLRDTQAVEHIRMDRLIYKILEDRV